MLRQVLTPAELSDLGLDVAAHALPRAERPLTFGAYVECRRYMVFSCVPLWLLGIGTAISCSYRGDGSVPIAAVGVAGALLVLLFTMEIMLGLRLLHDTSSCTTTWDFVGHFLGVSDKLVFFCDLVFPAIAWSAGFHTTAILAFGTCLVTYICLVGIQQCRMLLGLYCPKDDYTVQHLEKFFLSPCDDAAPTFVRVPLSLAWMALTHPRRTHEPAPMAITSTAIEMHESAAVPPRVEKKGATDSLEDGISTEDDVPTLATGGKYLSPKLPGQLSSATSDESSGSDASDGSDRILSSVDPQLQPPSIGDLAVFSPSYLATATLFRWLTALRVYGPCFSVALWRLVSGGSRQYSGNGNSTMSTGQSGRLLNRHHAAGGSAPLGLLLPLRTASSLGHPAVPPSSFSAARVMDAWMRNYKEQADAHVADAKIMQLTNTAFLTQCMFLQSALRRVFLPPDCIEAHEFSMAFTSLGRCFMADMLLCLLKSFLLLAWARSSAFIIFSLGASIFQASAMCFYNTIDGDLWQDILTLE